MPRPFQTNPWHLATLLTEIDNGQIVVPQFQRSFVWDPGDTLKLLVSVSDSYPAGSLLFLKQGGSGPFEFRLVEGVDDSATHRTGADRLVLDGQQRLTSLYQALYSKGEHFFYANLQKLDPENRGSVEEGFFYLPPKRAIEAYGNDTQQFDEHVLPLSVVFSRWKNFDRWMDEYIEHWESKKPGNRAGLRGWLRGVYDSYLKPIYEYEFPVVELDSKTSLDAVCSIFVSVNTTGVQLTTFELLTALLYKVGTRLRDLWETARASYPLIRSFLVDDEPDYLLKVVALMKPPSEGSTLPSCKRSDLLRLTKQDIETYWYPATEYLAQTLSLLKGECGILSRRWLPYISILPPMTAALAFLEHQFRGPERGACKQKLLRWFWCSVFTQRYDTAVDSKSATDVIALRTWFSGGVEPEPVRALAASGFPAQFLREIEKQSNAIYRGVMSLLVRVGAIDFHKQVRISTLDLASEDIEDHHVFPRGYLGNKVPKTSTNCILNRTLIDAQTNKVIRSNAPSAYLQRIQLSGVDARRLEEILKSHLLVEAPESPLLRDDFAAFLDERQRLLGTLIDNVTRPGVV